MTRMGWVAWGLAISLVVTNAAWCIHWVDRATYIGRAFENHKVDDQRAALARTIHEPATFHVHER